MYVCLCKALTEADVVARTRDCIREGATSYSAVIDALDLHSDEACGFCVENPHHIEAIFEDELEVHLGFTCPNGQSAPLS